MNTLDDALSHALSENPGSAECALEWLARRYSVGPKHLGLPAPSADELAQAVALACRAPDHGQLRPYRFVVVPTDRRAELAELFAQAAAHRGQNEAGIQDARQRAYNGPGLLALVVRVQGQVDDVPEHEQWLAAGAALMNLLNGLHLQGYGAKVLSGATLRDAALQLAFCETDEQLVAWVCMGTPLRGTHARAQALETAQPVLQTWRSQP